MSLFEFLCDELVPVIRVLAPSTGSKTNAITRMADNLALRYNGSMINHQKFEIGKTDVNLFITIMYVQLLVHS